jgi:peptidoglycan-N-acetylglucosamine deacetylase
MIVGIKNSKVPIRYCLFILSITLMGCSSTNHQELAGICISFDDRTIHEWYEMRPVLDEYDAKVTFFISQFDSLSESEIDKLKVLKGDGHEIGSHGAMHVVAEYYIKENSYKEYIQNEIEANSESMKKAGLDPVSFAYPYGSKYWFTNYLIGQKFKMIRNVYPKKVEDIQLADDIYYRFGDEKEAWALGIDRISNLSEEMVRKAIEKAASEGSVLMLYGHVPSSNTESKGYDFDVKLLRFILSQAREKGLKFYRVGDLRN